MYKIFILLRTIYSYGNMNALNPSVLPIAKNYGVYYRDRIYYFSNEDERAKAMNQPL